MFIDIFIDVYIYIHIYIYLFVYREREMYSETRPSARPIWLRARGLRERWVAIQTKLRVYNVYILHITYYMLHITHYILHVTYIINICNML